MILYTRTNGVTTKHSKIQPHLLAQYMRELEKQAKKDHVIFTYRFKG